MSGMRTHAGHTSLSREAGVPSPTSDSTSSQMEAWPGQCYPDMLIDLIIMTSARLRVCGVAVARPLASPASAACDLVSVTGGGLCLGYSDAHYGHPRNIIKPGPGVNMGDGWETARRLDRSAIICQRRVHT